MIGGLALCLAWTASAHNGNPDKLRAEKIAFITSELNLTPAEAEKFWPVYNEIDGEKKAATEVVMEAKKALRKAIKDGADDATLTSLTKAFIEAKSKLNAIDTKTLERYQKVLSAEKVAKLYLAEAKFHRQQFDRLGGGKNDRRPGEGSERGGFHHGKGGSRGQNLPK